MSLELAREHKDLQARYEAALYRVHRLEALVLTLEERLKERDEETAKLRRLESLELWEKERKREWEEWAVRERELKGDIARLTDQLEEQKTATQKTVLTLQNQVKKSEMKAGMVMSENEYYRSVDNFRKDMFQQKMLTARRERVRKNQLGVFVGIMRGLRLDFRILMEAMDTEVKSFLRIKDDTSPCPLKCFPRFLELMAILDDVQYHCSGDNVAQLMTDLPAHYSSLEESLKLATSRHHNSLSMPNSPVATPIHKPKEKGSPLAHKRSLTTPSGDQPLPPVQPNKSSWTRRALSFKDHSSSSDLASPVHNRKLPRHIPKPIPSAAGTDGTKSTSDVFGLSPRQPRRIIATKNNLKMPVVSPDLGHMGKVSSLDSAHPPPSDQQCTRQFNVEQ